MQFTDSVSYLRGNHSFKFGGEVLVNQSTNNVTANTKGPRCNLRRRPCKTSSPANMKQRALSHPVISLRHLQNQGYAAFLQDDWRITPRLTVNLGFATNSTPFVKENDNLIGNFDPTKDWYRSASEGSLASIMAITTISRRASVLPGISPAMARPWFVAGRHPLRTGQL